MSRRLPAQRWKIMQMSKHEPSRRAVLTVLVGAAGGTVLIGGVTGISSLNAEPTADRGQVTLYKNPECGCCEGYADYLRHNGFKVTAVPTNDLTVMGEKYGIPDSLQPCHISLIGSYVVGGHIPIEVVNRLLSEKPQIAGITLPGMPEGTPGMPGKKHGPLQIYEIGMGPPKVYATV
jgi:hypothetical protein